MTSRLTYAEYLEENEAEAEETYPCSCGRIVEPQGLFDVRDYDDEVISGEWRCWTCISHQDRIEKAGETHPAPSWSTDCEIGNAIRAERMTRIEQVRWLRERHADQVMMEIEPTLSQQDYTTLLDYIQSLRTITDDFESPDLVVWPEKPSFLP